MDRQQYLAVIFIIQILFTTQSLSKSGYENLLFYILSSATHGPTRVSILHYSRLTKSCGTCLQLMVGVTHTSLRPLSTPKNKANHLHTLTFVHSCSCLTCIMHVVEHKSQVLITIVGKQSNRGKKKQRKETGKKSNSE